MTAPEQQAIISGIGQSQVGRRLGRSGLSLTLDAIVAAVEDAGLSLADIDGLASYPGNDGPAGGAAVSQVHDALRLDLAWHGAYGEGPAQLTAFHHACLAVASGFARHVVVYRTVTEATSYAQGVDGEELLRQIPGMSWMLEWMLPFGAMSVVNWVAPIAQRHFHEHGTTKEQLAAVPLTARRHAALNPTAVYRGELTLDDYLDARMISTPFGLYDCDVPVDGSSAFVVSHVDHAGELPHPAVGVNALGWACDTRRPWDQFPDLYGAMGSSARQMWARSDCSPADVDVACLYDGFSIIPLLWLEALGFCPVGESGAFVEGGSRIRLGGELPINTNGGQLSGGRLHGYGFLHEACVQLRGEGADRQVPDAEVAVVTNGVGPAAGCALLTRHR